MVIRHVAYFFKQAWISISRNKVMSLATVMNITVSLFIVGVFSLLVLNANYFAQSIQQSVEIAVFMDLDASREQALDVQEVIDSVAGVSSSKLVPKEEGIEQLNQQFGKDHDLLQALGGENPLPDYLVVRVASPTYLDYVTGKIAALDGVKKAQYGQDVMDRVFKLTQYIQWIGLVIMIILCLLAIFLIFITIKLTVFNRQKEIKVMKYVGSSDGFIRAPFVIKGGLLGFVGAFLADVSLFFAYYMVSDSIQSSLSFVSPLEDPIIMVQVLGGILLTGTLIGLFGSNLSIRKYLKV